MPEVFGKEVNRACIKRGQELLREAKEDKKRRKEASSRDLDQAAKDIATGIVGIGKKRVMPLPDKIIPSNLMSNADRRARGFPEDPDMEDYKGGEICS